MSDTALWVTVWLMSGMFLGGVVTPLVAQNKSIGEWGVTALGVVIGAVGHVALLVPLWAAIARLPRRVTAGPAWRADAISARQALAEVEEQPAPAEQLETVLGLLRHNFWPAARPAGEHSHRMAYVRVFVALAVNTRT